ncbi:orotidine 5'-phosphate decarboxylase [Candidatus Gottesmanbacteria bacterium RIFCSPHIGHO2_01_FULL_39_10]|uniref:Orotidine-5'-phosphate decarboxylase n=1 Tax=Candidatus Gottesmanbacteria bacterium RIFCSPHIGHO2_01_FULL_39_10 TaxID=1798375 RepID=A0A1F5ZLP9_9BACT|nr:MAG: orotidine 5'-phosphate decarboxylase [Candidatus Gottesmanbacteria bacterium RIFCSPHIGHO2_01_FULL_39_10]
MTFKDKLKAIVKKNNSLVCVGLDSQLDKIPAHIRKLKNPIFDFNKAIIDATYNLVCTYKPNAAFYEAEGLHGIEQLKMTCDYLHEKYPTIPIIFDAKRADIGNTNKGYARFAFDYLGADAITLQPYFGIETLKSFLDRTDKSTFILVRTSNPGAGELQDLIVEGKPLYQVVAEHVAQKWNYNGNCFTVVGAPYPHELDIVRHIIGDGFPILIPGIGIQGGNVEITVKAGVDKDGQNAIINSSRGIIFASSGEDFAQRAREEAEKLRTEINKYRTK